MPRPRRRNRKRELLILALLAIVLVAGNLILPDPDPVKPVGRARVIDGDSLVVDGRAIRLKGIDAPELAQTCRRNGNDWKCGEEALRQLRFFVHGGDVACEGDEFDEHGRLLAVCTIGGRSVNGWMVEEGWAVAYGNYQDQQDEARAKRRGLWQGSFESPRDWRKAHPRR